MKFRLVLILLLIAVPVLAQSAHFGYGNSGTATTTNATVTVPFNPQILCVMNTGATNNLLFDYTDGVATTANDSTNHLLFPGRELCFSWDEKSPTGSLTVGVIASTATTTYNINATRR